MEAMVLVVPAPKMDRHCIRYDSFRNAPEFRKFRERRRETARRRGRATDDADDTKAAVIKLILARELADADTARAELLAMKTSLLRKQAIAMGVSPEAIEDADDAADLKAALADLILAAQPSG